MACGFSRLSKPIRAYMLPVYVHTVCWSVLHICYSLCLFIYRVWIRLDARSCTREGQCTHGAVLGLSGNVYHPITFRFVITFNCHLRLREGGGFQDYKKTIVAMNTIKIAKMSCWKINLIGKHKCLWETESAAPGPYSGITPKRISSY